ncbi:MAG TPA: N-acetylneuraminate synthase family protein [Myxococcota bacterium]|jgi:N-acetylneuraminate synthase/sialic acid synthase|nr:N-acetylneuraminate synthase family protein [Myxococcota bacterium]
MRELTIDGVRIDDATDAYVIAEVGHNHGGDLETCKQLFRAAKEAGAHAVKLQKRDNRSLYTREAYAKAYENENSFGATYGEHREALELGRREYLALQQYCKELEIAFFATAFDIPSADFLAELDVPAYKIASGDLKTTPLLEHVARIGKPVILSTGGASLDDVRRAADTILPLNSQLCVLQCTAGYPAKFEELDLRVIETFRREFPESVIGLSSHDNGIAMAVAAYLLGARVIEKHFTMNRAWKGTDHAFSLEPTGLRKMVRDLERTRVALGDGVKKVHASERAPLQKMGKTLVAARALAAGTVLGPEDVAMKSPGGAGLAPYHWDDVIGATLTAALPEDGPITFEVLERKA